MNYIPSCEYIVLEITGLGICSLGDLQVGGIIVLKFVVLGTHSFGPMDYNQYCVYYIPFTSYQFSRYAIGRWVFDEHFRLGNRRLENPQAWDFAVLKNHRLGSL